ncbi:MAG TPA: formate dehydrogenase accessory protein FdhE [Malonomonas sp.]
MPQLSEKLLRLKELTRIRPQYSEIYAFYSGLCTFLQNNQPTWLNCSPELESWPARCQTGFPLLTREALQIDVAQAGQSIAALVECLLELGQQGQAELRQIAQALAADKFPCEKLLIACLEKDRAPFEAAATELEIPSALLEYVCSTTLSNALQQWLAAIPYPPLDGWQEGYCPICGAIPAMGELVGEEGRKKLHCSLCATGWEVSRLKCTYCGDEKTDGLEYFTAEGETGYRVDICRKCSCYLKVADSRELGTGLPMDVEDINSMHLDLMAQKEGFAKGKIDQKR